MTFAWLPTASGLLAALVVVVSLARTIESSRLKESRANELAQALRDRASLRDLQARRPELMTSHLAIDGLAPRITTTLSVAGVPKSALQSLSPEAESPSHLGQGVQLFRKRATFTLVGVTLPNLGRFLDAWRHAEPAWTITSLDLAPASGPAPPQGGDLPLRVIITIDSIRISRLGASP